MARYLVIGESPAKVKTIKKFLGSNYVKNVFDTNMLQWSNVVVEGAVYGLVGGALSQLGDLIASAIKRDTGIKDFGWIFPGHGGFMDRFDSVMFIAPIMYILPMVIFGVM